MRILGVSSCFVNFSKFFFGSRIENPSIFSILELWEFVIFPYFSLISSRRFSRDEIRISLNSLLVLCNRKSCAILSNCSEKSRKIKRSKANTTAKKRIKSEIKNIKKGLKIKIKTGKLQKKGVEYQVFHDFFYQVQKIFHLEFFRVFLNNIILLLAVFR